jgi:hypothetical protein
MSPRAAGARWASTTPSAASPPASGSAPAWPPSEHLQLGYAATIHLAQGTTVDTTHTVLTGRESRQQLYVALTRGRHDNHLHLATAGAGDRDEAAHPTLTRAEQTVVPPKSRRVSYAASWLRAAVS